LDSPDCDLEDYYNEFDSNELFVLYLTDGSLSVAFFGPLVSAVWSAIVCGQVIFKVDADDQASVAGFYAALLSVKSIVDDPIPPLHLSPLLTAVEKRRAVQQWGESTTK
jgi:hypothetical protein